MAIPVHILPKGNPFATEQVSVDHATTEDQLTVATFAPAAAGVAEAAYILVLVDAIIWGFDANLQTSGAANFTAAVGDVIILNSTEQIRAFRADKVTNTATLHVAYFRGC